MWGGLGGWELGCVGTHTRRGLWFSVVGQEVGSLPGAEKTSGEAVFRTWSGFHAA